MKKMAVVPFSSVYFNDQLFNLDNKVLNRDDALKVFVILEKYLKSVGWEIHTMDVYSEYEGLDLIVFFTFDVFWYQKILKKHLEDKTIYIAFEPPVVDENHSSAGIQKLLKFFKYILTWNDEIVDDKRIFKFMYPYYFNIEKSEVSFEEKKLLVNVSGNKQSHETNELYSERKKVICFFDDDSSFELYGTNWNAEEYRSYRGMAERKKDIYHHFKFALCLENMKEIDGYITEKILDCFCAGIVPVYMGAKNIDQYISEKAYIAYDQFNNLEEMKRYLNDIQKDQYEEYLEAADIFLNSENINVFSPIELGKTLIKLSDMEGYQFSYRGGVKKYQLRQLLRKIHKIIQSKA